LAGVCLMLAGCAVKVPIVPAMMASGHSVPVSPQLIPPPAPTTVASR